MTKSGDSRLRQVIAGFDPEVPIERASMPTSSWYVDSELCELERRHILHNSWQPVGRVQQLGEAGSYVSGCFAGEPWVVVRGNDGALRAFHNVCRHKGREVVTGSGTAEQLVCGYHAWSYDHDGSLRKAPRMAGIENFDRADMSLRPLALETWGPWLFVNFASHNHAAAEPGSLRAQLAELDAELESGAWGQLRFVAHRSWTIDCNWKVYVDNYLDGGYHVPHMHPSLDAQLDMNSYRTELYERYSIQTCAPAVEADERIEYDAVARIGDRAIYAWIYPNFMLNRYGSCLDSNYVVPLGPGRCEVHYDFFFLETEGSEACGFIEESIEQAELTQREDIAICESVQIGLGSDSYDRGRYAPKVEIGEHHFHRLLAADYRRAVS
jgi:choline monooxygenase